MSQLIVADENHKVLVVAQNKDERHRLSQFAAWVEHWAQPDLAAYRDDLLEKGYAPATVAAHLSTIRSRYQAIMGERDRFFSLIDDSLPFSERKAMVDEIIARLGHAIDPKRARVRVVKKQDVADSEHLRLKPEQANRLMRQPGMDTLRGCRDTALIALMLSTGIREGEACNLVVSDLRQSLGGELALLVREGKGAKQRLIPYGELDEVLAVVERWLGEAGIKTGYVFRGFLKGGYVTREGITTRTVQRILESYPIIIGGQVRAVKPHDLRRTAAKLMYDAGLEVPAIQQNFGHAKIETTWGYIGTLEASRRRAKAVYDFTGLV